VGEHKAYVFTLQRKLQEKASRLPFYHSRKNLNEENKNVHVHNFTSVIHRASDHCVNNEKQCLGAVTPTDFIGS
jgi:hypothetical protein